MSQSVAPTSPQQAALPELAQPPAGQPLPPAAPPPPDRLESSCDCCGCFTLIQRCVSFILELCGKALGAVGSFFRELLLCCCSPRAYRERQQTRAYIDWLNAGDEVRPQQEILARLRTLPRRAIIAVRHAVERRHADEIEGIARGFDREEQKAVPRRSDERAHRPPPRPSREELSRQAITQFLRENPAHLTVIEALQQFIEELEVAPPRDAPQRIVVRQAAPRQTVTRLENGRAQPPVRFVKVSRDENKEREGESWRTSSRPVPRQNTALLPPQPSPAPPAGMTQRPVEVNRTRETTPPPAAAQGVPGQIRPLRIDPELLPFTQYSQVAHPPESQAVPAHLD